MQKHSALHECVMDSGMQSLPDYVIQAGEKSRFRDTQIWVFIKQPILLVELNRRKFVNFPD